MSAPTVPASSIGHIASVSHCSGFAALGFCIPPLSHAATLSPKAETGFDADTSAAQKQLLDETIEALQLARASPDLDDLGATFAVALLKLGMATGFVEQRHPGFAKDIEEKRQRVLAALIPKH